MSQTQSRSKTVINPFTEQQPFLQADKRYLGYISGVGAGKTFSGIIRTIRNMTEWNSGEMGAIIAPTRQMIVNVIIPEMRRLWKIILDRTGHHKTERKEHTGGNGGGIVIDLGDE